ncbi:hypothetical protein KBY27_09075, partial [Ruegeria pomeroyi]
MSTAIIQVPLLYGTHTITQSAWTANGSGSHSSGPDASSIDFDVPNSGDGTPVFAIADGIIIDVYSEASEHNYSNPAEWSNIPDPGPMGYGNVVTVLHNVVLDNGTTLYFVATYSHLSSDSAAYIESLLENAETTNSQLSVSAGTYIGGVSNTSLTGRSSGTHLHLQIGSDIIEEDGVLMANGHASDANRSLLETLVFSGAISDTVTGVQQTGESISEIDVSFPNTQITGGAYSPAPQPISVSPSLVYEDQSVIDPYSMDGSSNVGLLFSTTHGYTFVGLSGNDTITGGGGNDSIFGGSGNDIVDGGGGVDIVYYNHWSSNYDISRINENTIAVSGQEGLDFLTDVEGIYFPDQNFAVDLIPYSGVCVVGEEVVQTNPDDDGALFIRGDAGSIISFSLSSIGLAFDAVRGWSAWDILAYLGPQVAYAAEGDIDTVDIPVHGSANPDAVLRVDTNYQEIEIIGVGSVQIQDLIDGVAPDDHTDTQPSAVQIGSGTITSFTSAAGSIESRNDVDVFRAELQAGQQYSFILWANSTQNSRLDPELTIRAPNGAVWRNDNLTNSTTMSFISFVAPVSGTYFFEARGVGDSTGAYWLNITPINIDPTADNLTPTTGATDPGNSYWDWEGTSGDDYPSELTLEQGGAPDVNDDNRYRGHDGDDTLRGFDGDDIIWGDDDEDRIYGGDGDDTIRGGRHDDTIDGDDGDDLIFGESGDDFIDGDISSSNGFGHDTIYAGDGDDDVDGGRGNDYIKGEDDNDTLDGNDGNDEIYGDRGNDFLDGDDGDDQLFGGPGSDDLDGGDGRDRLAGEGGNDDLDGDDGDDALYGGDDDDNLRGGAGDDLLHGEDGTDTADFSDGDAGVLINLFDEIAVSSDLGTDRLYSIENVLGSNGNDVIDGNHGWNEIYGDDGDDIIRGHNGNDTIDGQWDDDVVWGDAGDDYVYGGSGHDEVRGGLGNDHLFGGSGDDHLRGEQNDDVIDGGSGLDTVFFWGEHDDFSIQLGTSGEVIVTDLRTDGLEGRDTLTNVEYFEFFDGIALVSDLLASAPSAANDTLTVEGDRPALLDLLANDALNSTGAHYLAVSISSGGGSVSIIGGSVVFDPGEDFSHLNEREIEEVTVSYEIETNGFQRATATATIRVVGTSRPVNVVAGTDAPETLTGGSGVDSITGLGGADRLEGGAGADTLDGGAGSDTIYGGAGDDVLEGGIGGDDVNGGSGIDTASFVTAGSGVTANLTSGVGSRGNANGDTYTSIENLLGSDHDDLLTGSSGNNLIEGGRGKDSLRGSAGNDTLEGGIGGDDVNGGSGIDTASFVTAGSGVTANLTSGVGSRGNA